ncbi:M23 family metallopeptidase [Edaphobacter acidisoli]|uniref:M23 family metallopeptidase n=1 Tax=Edaphobacter acidisoli TaxID=2040573 RepID=UPI001E5C7A2E|nr:M23 family metallopeptidase [Edaphobacter acidisoli]
MSFRKKYYIIFVSRDEDGTLDKVPVPLHYAYIFVAAAAIGLFTITGLAGSYTRMLVKTAKFNQLRADHNALQQDYAHLEKTAHEKDVEAASLGSLAGEVSALYGLTANKLAMPVEKLTRRRGKTDVAEEIQNTPLVDPNNAMTDTSYYKSVDAFYALRSSAMNGLATRALATMGSRAPSGFGSPFDMPTVGADLASYIPTLWPIMGPITSSFGEREDPVLGNGEGEFHAGIDIGAPNGTPIRATGDGVVMKASMGNGYGREVIIDHGHGIETLYGHMSGFACAAGESVVRGQIIGYVGHSGRTTGSHLHYEVRIHNTPVNPHKYLRVTLAGLGDSTVKGS